MSLRDFPPFVWEVLFFNLAARHQTRLAATGDARVIQALANTWRHFDLSPSHRNANSAENVLCSTLVTSLLIGRARQLSIADVDFTTLVAPLPLLVSLTLDSPVGMCESLMKNLSANVDQTSNAIFDLRRWTPNLRFLTMDCDNFEYTVRLPQTLETLSFTFLDCDEALSHFENLADLPNLTAIAIDTDYGSRVVHENVAWPPNLTRLALDVTTHELNHIRYFPRTLRSLYVVNLTDDVIDTSVFDFPLLTKLIIDGNGTGVCLTIVPPLLERLELASLIVGDGTSLLRAVRTLPSSLIDVSIERLEQLPSDVTPVIEALKHLLPRFGLDGLGKLASSLTESLDEAETKIRDFLLGELRKAGPTGSHVAQELIFSSCVWYSSFDRVAPIVQRAQKDGLSNGLIASVVREYWRRHQQMVLSDLESPKSNFLLSSIEWGAVDDLYVTIRQCCTLSPKVASRLVTLSVDGFNASQLDAFLSVKFDSLTTLNMFIVTQNVSQWEVIINTIPNRRINLPVLEHVYLRCSSDVKPEVILGVQQALAEMRMYPTSLPGAYCYRVSPPRQSTNDGKQPIQ